MRRRSENGSVVLVALSCVTVLAIATASFLALSNQAMKLSNRDYAKSVSRQLAEMGLERALRSYSNNTFSSWTQPDAITANKTLTIASDNFGNSIASATANIKVVHFLDTRKGTIWNDRTAYSVDDFVWYRGVWYLCTSAAAAGVAPSTTANWRAAPESWNAYANYEVGNIALAGGTAYRCIVANINQTPPNATYWTTSTSGVWSSATSYSLNDVAVSGGVPYRCILAHTGQAPPNTTYWLSAPVIYSEGVAVLPDSGSTTIKTQLRAMVAPAPLFPNALGAADRVTLATTGTVDSYNAPLTAAWSNSTAYRVGDVVRSGAGPTYTFYRCKAAHTNQAVTNTTYWSPSPANALGFSAVIAGGNTTSTGVSVISTLIGGYISVKSSSSSPYAPQVSLATGSAVKLLNSDGSNTSPHATATNVDQTRISRSPFVPDFDIQSVTGGGTLPSTGTNYLPDGATTLGTAGASAPSVYNISGTWDGGSLYSGVYLSDTADTLTINGPVILNVTGTLYTSSGRIIINTTGSLEVYFTGQLWIGSGATSGIQNKTLDPKKCVLVGTSTANTSGSHYYWSTDPFYGVIYMPDAYVSTWTNVNIYGAISAKNIIFPSTSGSVNEHLHYDTSLRTAGSVGTYIDQPYKISELRELTDPSEKITLP